MRGTLCAVSVGKTKTKSRSSVTESRLVLDPTEDEIDDGWGVFAFVFGETFGSGSKAGLEPVWVDCVGLSAATEVRPQGSQTQHAC